MKSQVCLISTNTTLSFSSFTHIHCRDLIGLLQSIATLKHLLFNSVRVFGVYYLSYLKQHQIKVFLNILRLPQH